MALNEQGQHVVIMLSVATLAAFLWISPVYAIIAVGLVVSLGIFWLFGLRLVGAFPTAQGQLIGLLFLSLPLAVACSVFAFYADSSLYWLPLAPFPLALAAYLVGLLFLGGWWQVKRREIVQVENARTEWREFELRLEREMAEQQARKQRQQADVEAEKRREAERLRDKRKADTPRARPSDGLDDAREILGLDEPFTLAELKKRYRELSRKVHPDVGGSARMFRDLTAAYERLKKIKK